MLGSTFLVRLAWRALVRLMYALLVFPCLMLWWVALGAWHLTRGSVAAVRHARATRRV